jgi:signal transduction histidine kinase/DNA-binding response OmpR family regulator
MTFDYRNINYIFVLLASLISWSLSAKNVMVEDAYSLRYSDPYRAINLLEQDKNNLEDTIGPSVFKSYYLLIHLYLKTEQYQLAETTFNQLQAIVEKSDPLLIRPLQPKLALIRAHLMLHNQNIKHFTQSLTPYLKQLNNKQLTPLNTYYLYLLGSYQIQKTQFTEAIQNLTMALEQATKLNHRDYVLAIQNQLVMIFYYTKQYEKGLNLSDKMIAMADEINDRFTRVLALKNKMSLYYIRAIDLANSIGDDGVTNPQYIADMAKTNELQQQVIIQAGSIKAYRLMIRAMIVKQNQSLSIKDFEQAVKIGKQTLAFAEQHKLVQETAVTYNNMAIALRYLNQFEQSIAALKKAEGFYQKNQPSLNQESLRWIYEDYALTYEMAGDFEKALSNYKEFHKLSLSFINKTNNEPLLELQEKYAAKEKDLEITRLNHQAALNSQQLKTEKMGRWLLSIILFGLTVIAIVLCQKRRKLKSLLEKEAALNQQVIELNKAKHRFFTNISHEFRTALTLSIGPLKNMLSKKEKMVSDKTNDGLLAEKQPGYAAIETALENNLHMMTLLNEVLDIEKIDAKTLPVHISEFDFIQAIENCLIRFQLQFKQKQINLIKHGFAKKVSLHCDPSHFDKIIANILSNAGKYCVRSCSIILKLVEVEEALMLEISDDGPGIESAELPHVFKRFYQGKCSIEQQLPGTGIGLSMVKELIELHHGTINISSQYGKGCCVQLVFKKGYQHYSQQVIDCLKEKQQALCNSALEKNTYLNELKLSVGNQNQRLSQDLAFSVQTPELNASDKKVILVVDDNPAIRDLVREILKSDYLIVEAENGKKALKVAEKMQPDLLLVDVMMPEMDGYQLTKIIRSNSQLSHLSIMLLTALADTPQRVHGLELGADDYLAKPFDNDELKARVKNHLSQKQRLSELLLKEYKKLAVSKPSVAGTGASTGSGSGSGSGTSAHSRFEAQESKRSKLLDAIINQNLSQWEFGVEQMYTSLNMTRSSLYRYTQKAYGCSPMNLLKLRRLELAYQMLTEYKGTISEVAYAVGYQSLSAFSRAFREHYGHSPTKIKSAKATSAAVESC